MDKKMTDIVERLRLRIGAYTATFPDQIPYDAELDSLAADLIENQQTIIDQLPLTANDVRVYPGMQVFTGPMASNEVSSLVWGSPYAWAGYNEAEWVQKPLHMCYSTPEAAEDAMKADKKFLGN